MRELGFAFVGAVTLIALGVCAARKAESSDAWSSDAGYKTSAHAPAQNGPSHTAGFSAQQIVER